MWIFANDGRVIPGVPPRDMSDEEFEEVSREYEKNNQVPSEQKGVLRRGDLYKHVKDASSTVSEAGG